MSASRPTTVWWCKSPTATAGSHSRWGNRFMSAGAHRPARFSGNKKQEASMTFRINRRTALAGAASLATFPAAAQDNKKIIIGTWGGDYSRLLTKNIDTPLLVPKGWECIHDEANDPPRRAKMVAEKSLRRG